MATGVTPLCEPVPVLSELATVVGTLRDALAGFDAACCTPADATAIFTTADEATRLLGGLKLLVAPKVAEGSTWAKTGHRSPASWMAEVTGSAFQEAEDTLKVAARLERLPATAEALRTGKLSGAQAKAITGASMANPRKERELIEAAGRESLKQLKDRCKRIRTAALADEAVAAREERIHRARALRTTVDDDGAFRMDVRMTAGNGARLLAALEAEAKVVFDEARAAGATEPQAAYMADALLRLCTAAGPTADARRSRPDWTTHLFVSAAALKRGALVDGDVAEIPGVGQVSLRTARCILEDCDLKILVTDGVDIRSVAHAGRTIPAHVRTALTARDPLCVVPGCGASRFLEVHHWRRDYARGGRTELDNLCRICPHHHDLLTRGDFELTGGPGGWQFRRITPGKAPPGG